MPRLQLVTRVGNATKKWEACKKARKIQSLAGRPREGDRLCFCRGAQVSPSAFAAVRFAAWAGLRGLGKLMFPAPLPSAASSTRLPGPGSAQPSHCASAQSFRVPASRSASAAEVSSWWEMQMVPGETEDAERVSFPPRACGRSWTYVSRS